MSNFADIVKHLDLRRAAKDASGTLKQDTLYKARPIKKVQDTLTLPASFFLEAVVGTINGPRLMFQYNVTVGFNFNLHIPPVPIFASYIRGGSLFVKWREGSTVYRYRINSGLLVGVDSNALTQFDTIYNGETIKSNCVFEFWFVSYSFGLAGITQAVPLTLSRLRNPETAEDVGSNTDASAPLQIASIGVTLPEALPYTQDNQVWLNN